MLFLAFKGLNLFEIGLMETVYHISSFSMEIPTGLVADIYGRKTSRLLGKVALIIATLLMIYGNSTLFFAISFFFSALSNNLESGAGEAIIYDSFKELEAEKRYKKFRGRQELIYQFSQTISLLLGGYIATKSYMSIYHVTLILAVISTVFSMTFHEPEIGRVVRQHSVWFTFKRQILDSLNVVKKDKRLLEIVLLLELFSTFFMTEFYYIQNHLKSLGHSEFYIGSVLAAGGLCAAITATQTYKLEKYFRLKPLIISMALLTIPGFWLMTRPMWIIVGFILLATLEAQLFVTLGDYINRLIPSQQRATLLSLQSMVFSLFMIILFPIIGKLGDIYGLGKAFFLIAIIATIIMLLMVNIIRRGDHRH